MKDSFLIKVCGMREEQNILDVAALGVDLIGFIFWPESKRYVHSISSYAGIIPDFSSLHLDKTAKRVGVFVDGMPQNIVTAVYNYDLDYVQLHGSETPEMIENLKATLIPDIQPDIKIIKAISIEKPEDVDQYKAYEGIADLLLFDTKCKTVGGCGQQFDWSVLDRYQGETPFLLSGGIGPDDVERVKAFHHDKCIGIDLNSKFEDAPAVKNIEKLSQFIRELRNE